MPTRQIHMLGNLHWCDSFLGSTVDGSEIPANPVKIQMMLGVDSWTKSKKNRCQPKRASLGFLL